MSGAIFWHVSYLYMALDMYEIFADRKTIAWCPCTPLSTVEIFGEKISTEACSDKEIVGLMMMMMMMMIARSDVELSPRNLPEVLLPLTRKH